MKRVQLSSLILNFTGRLCIVVTNEFIRFDKVFISTLHKALLFSSLLYEIKNAGKSFIHAICGRRCWKQGQDHQIYVLTFLTWAYFQLKRNQVKRSHNGRTWTTSLLRDVPIHSLMFINSHIIHLLGMLYNVSHVSNCLCIIRCWWTPDWTNVPRQLLYPQTAPYPTNFHGSVLPRLMDFVLVKLSTNMVVQSFSPLNMVFDMKLLQNLIWTELC